MSHWSAVVLLLSWLATLGDARTIRVRAEIGQLQGTWQAVTLTVDGQTAPPQEDIQVEYVFQGQKLCVQGDGFVEDALFQLNPEAALKTIDVVNAEQPGPMTSGIYKITGNELVICFAGKGQPRPEDFTNEKGSGRTTFVLRRVDTAKLKAELARLQGTWKFVSAEGTGNKASEEQLARGRLTIQGTNFQIHANDNVVAEGTFTLDLTETAKRMRLLARDAGSEPSTFHAIYRWDGAMFEVTVELTPDTKPTDKGTTGPKGRAVFKRG